MRIGVGTKFQIRLTILIFWAEFAQKGCFWSEIENLHVCMCPWSFLTILNFFAGGPKDTAVFITRQDKGAQDAY